ncbi:hypothetical protein [Caldivirga maquilingensis]|uniref:hypothetical protein n=1 Tax=Caldivirga maquilingensis TaxID=76887 RepID=UPI00064F5C8E|nr:hypothetical protein [Caldivirga maquilingensis]
MDNTTELYISRVDAKRGIARLMEFMNIEITEVMNNEGKAGFHSRNLESIMKLNIPINTVGAQGLHENNRKESRGTDPS